MGARCVELPIEAQDAQDARGYERAQDESFYSRQRELLGKVIAGSDAVVTAAVIPGKQSPVLITEEMVKGDGARFGDHRFGGQSAAETASLRRREKTSFATM